MSKELKSALDALALAALALAASAIVASAIVASAMVELVSNNLKFGLSKGLLSNIVLSWTYVLPLL